eukprot:CAMPEP_0175478190 /NCGR_PEP_ID=MMETSP0095-20121207/76807_1 /TAXON_ID=311494 /ORGANISM="Alexandrium monilatum, Strain CCMP3105" /LENGTH=197 /DNA_ID=CAMNT_0016779785 /DNA_START=26 /DNA_END=615 /DNA_ORIENTATION=+
MAEAGGYSNVASNNLTSVFMDNEGNAKGEIEQGHAIPRLVAFGSSCASIVCLVLHCINPVNVLQPVSYILHLYLGLFALTCILFEAPPEYVERISGANAYLEMLIKHCGFLCNNAGRGLFYIFQATLWMSFYTFGDLMVLAICASLTVVGVLSIFMQRRQDPAPSGEVHGPTCRWGRTRRQALSPRACACVCARLHG